MVTHRAHLFNGGVICVEDPSLDEALGQVQHLGKVIRCVGYRPLKLQAQPLHVSDDGIHILCVFLPQHRCHIITTSSVLSKNHMPSYRQTGRFPSCSWKMKFDARLICAPQWT